MADDRPATAAPPPTLTARLGRATLSATRLLPVGLRGRFAGRLVRSGLGSIAGLRRRARTNLDLIHPDWPDRRRAEVADLSLDNFGRVLLESLDPATMERTVAGATLSGDGWPEVDAAHAAGRPVLFVTGHIGTAIAPRLVFARRGRPVGVFVRALDDPSLHDIYVESLTAQAGPVFPKGRPGISQFVRHLHNGGSAVILFDVHDNRGEWIDFLGRPARTVMTPADVARRTGALLVPWFALRRGDWSRIEVIVERPIPDGPPIEMMREATRRLEARVAEAPEQYFWLHRRWRGLPAS